MPSTLSVPDSDADQPRDRDARKTGHTSAGYQRISRWLRAGKAYVTVADGDSGGPVYGFMSIDLATNKLGKPVKIVSGEPVAIAFAPDGKTAYVASYASGMVTPIAIATNTAGTPINMARNHCQRVRRATLGIAITPDGTTAYVTNELRTR